VGVPLLILLCTSSAMKVVLYPKKGILLTGMAAAGLFAAW